MWFVIILLSIGIMISLGCLWSKEGEDTEIRIVTGIGILILAMLFGAIIALGNTPTIEDGEIIKCDTLYYKK